MRGSPAFLRVEEVLAIHRRVVEEFGGSGALRDSALLESAVHMPAATFGRKLLHGTIPAMAGAYLFHLCKNHPFVDGNKRTALAAAEIFLMVNGFRLRSSDRELEDLTMRVAGGDAAKDEVIALFLARAELDHRQTHDNRGRGRSGPRRRKP